MTKHGEVVGWVKTAEHWHANKILVINFHVSSQSELLSSDKNNAKREKRAEASRTISLVPCDPKPIIY